MQLSERAPKTTFERAESFLSSLARRFEPEKEVKGGAVRRPYGLYVRQSGDSPSESEKAGSVTSEDGRRFRAGLIARTATKGVIMINNGKSADWIFPRGGIDDRYDGWDEDENADKEPFFRRAASREAYEEAGIILNELPQNLEFLTRTDNEYEYYFSGTVGSLWESWPEKELLDADPTKEYTITRKEFTGADALEQLTVTNKKKQTIMIEALEEAIRKGLVDAPTAADPADPA